MGEKDLSIPAEPRDLIRAVLRGGGVPAGKKPKDQQPK
jgi:hypothetical protein